MPGPFPGFDPFLENEWEDVHAALIGAVRAQLNERLPPDLVCRAEKSVQLLGGDPDGGPRWVRPDDFVAVASPSGSAEGSAGSAVLAQSETYTVAPETQVHKWLEVRDVGGNEVVTTIELLSPANKTGRERERFREKQRDLVEAGVSLVEIDLLRRGLWALYPAEDAVPEAYREPYRLCSTEVQFGKPRSTFTRVRLREPLPAIPVPLRADEEPVALELQPLIDRVWGEGRYGNHYRGDAPPFPPEDAAWVAERVREWGERAGSAGPSGAKEPEKAAPDRPPPTGSPRAG
ncbi:DUF4058 family protein [Alienimonas sp. DA493]|uniref:DUF4058 family protein n=1 Tax=Alienimonas sp. DA493 TaxID=3373605 RepID=UPI00375511F4